MNSSDFYATVRREWGPWLRKSGFARSGDLTGLPYPRAGLWVKYLRDAPPPPAPERLAVAVEEHLGRFTVTIEAGAAARIGSVLDDAQRRQIALKLGAILRPEDDVWFPYANPDEAVAWLKLLRPWIASAAVRIAGSEGPLAEFADD